MVEDIITAVSSFITSNYLLVCFILVCCIRFMFATKNKKFEEYPGNNVIPITTHAAWDAAIQESKLQNKLIVVDFYALWCPPCRAASPIYGKMSTGISFL